MLLIHGVGEERALATDDDAMNRMNRGAALDLHVTELAGGEVPG